MQAKKERRSPKAATERLEARVPVSIKALVDRAAAFEGRTLTDYVIATLERHSAEVVREHELLRLSTADSEVFARAMISPPKPGRKLRKAFERHGESVEMR